ncbi:LysR family transcriptional regulator [Nocardioides daeguensis]|uniref:LysR family transcriptional regulator n=1 Tax=Nocardioides daeguensis TaxID=908359 RepID=A0ABP6V6L0_9ACTN|nr:LysR family transcriptional regulator [Nocardioides daeguensis]MBV6726279.1 LysR family transcriptional regulator [Nocardioides daeguensis]MCR1772122.1 LysR family transcriptional regulator [Nocardioides daeguensis]
MDDPDSGLEVKAFRTFLAVVDHGSFSAAARALGTTQPTVSRIVAGVEGALGVSLVVRSTRSLALTEAGRTFASQARRVLDNVAVAHHLTRRAAAPEPSLVVAVKADGDGGLLREAIATFETTGHRVELLLRETRQLAEAVRTGEADVGLLAGPPVSSELTDLDTELVFVEPRVTMLHAGHRHAGRERIGLEELVEEPVATWPDAGEELDRFYQGLAPGDPGRMTTGPAVRDLAEVLRLVEMGRAITFLPESVARRFEGRAIAAVPTDGVAPSALRLVWRPSSRDLAVAAFVRHVLDIAEQHSEGPRPVDAQR